MACANPATGHYNKARSILDNIRISNAILSRFDLVFLMLDDPDLNRDRMLSEHIMKLHGRKRKRSEISGGYTSQSGYSSTATIQPGNEAGYNTNFESDGGTYGH